jgi:hypothetical protein
VREGQQPDTVVFGGQRGHDFPRLVTAPIVGDDDFPGGYEIGKGSPQAVNAGSDAGFLVECRDDYREERAAQ